MLHQRCQNVLLPYSPCKHVLLAGPSILSISYTCPWFALPLYECLPLHLKVPSGQTGSAWEWYHWRGLKKVFSPTDFWFLIFSFEYLKRLQSSESLHTKMPLIFINFCMKRLRTLKSFQIFKTEIKKSKTYSGWCDDVPFQAYPTVPLSCRSNLAGRYL